MQSIHCRLPDELFEEVQRLADAENISVGLWNRRLIEEKTGIKVDVKIGLAGADAETHARVQALAIKGIKKKKAARHKKAKGTNAAKEQPHAK